MDNAEKLATYGTQDEKKTKQKTQHSMCWTPLLKIKYSIFIAISIKECNDVSTNYWNALCIVCVEADMVLKPARVSVPYQVSPFFMSCLRYLCFFANSGVQHILCCVFVLYLRVKQFLAKFVHQHSTD
jgi:hypothetical protein